MIIPSIDLINGKAVQLIQGKEDKKAVEIANIIPLAKEFNKYGEIAVIDLDAAFDKGENLHAIAEICKTADCRVGGGIRDFQRAEQILSFGAKKIIIGTRADPDFLSAFNPRQIIVALDAKDNRVVTNGWKKTTDSSPIERITKLEDYCSEFLYTDVNREGLLAGISLEAILSLKQATSNELTYAGGINSIQDIVTLEKHSINSQIGMALYIGSISLAEAFIECLDFEKNGGLIPTVVQDEVSKQVLMLAYSTPESLARTFGSFSITDQTFQETNAVYYSRSRDKLWEKGGTSGNFQRFVKARFDCDRDSIVFTVRQTGNACHTGRYSCFGDKPFSLEELQSVILKRIGEKDPDSYTYRLSQDNALLIEKLREELDELINFRDRKNLIWEAADLLYFLTVFLAKHEVSIEDALNELRRRRK